jgi:hypothetical protein
MGLTSLGSIERKTMSSRRQHATHEKRAAGTRMGYSVPAMRCSDSYDHPVPPFDIAYVPKTMMRGLYHTITAWSNENPSWKLVEKDVEV